ncbi:MAG: enoyl-CoA hydratase/isomerase family protein [Candidatus Helarchaeota archaeon]
MNNNFNTIKFETRDNGIAILTLNRPDKLNAIDFEMIEELHQVFDFLMTDLNSRVLILIGAGNSFCSGADLKSTSVLLSRKKSSMYKKYFFLDVPEVIKSEMYYLWRISEITLKMRKIPQPIIAAIHGYASGGGFTLTMASDIRIASEDAKFNCAFINIGFTSGDIGASYFLPRLIGLSRASELMYTGRFLEADEAEQIGFIVKRVKNEELFNTGLIIANKLLTTSPLGLRMTKQALNISLDSPSLETIIQIENRTQVICMSSKDVVEGVIAWKNKKRPKFPLK